MKFKYIRYMLKVNTFIKVEITAIMLVLFGLLATTIIFSNKTASDTQEIGADIIKVQNNLIEFDTKVNHYINNDIVYFSNIKINKNSIAYNKSLDSFSSYLKHIKPKIDNYKKIDSLLSIKKQLYVEYAILSETKTNINHNDPKYDQFIINKELMKSGVKSQNSLINLELLNDINKYSEYLKNVSNKNVLRMTNQIDIKIIIMINSFIITIPIITICMIMLIIDLNKLFKSDKRKESFIQSLLDLKSRNKL